MGLFCINMCTYIKELWPLTPVRISYQLNIFRLNEGNLIKHCICLDIDKQNWVGIVMHQLVQIYNRVMVFKFRINFLGGLEGQNFGHLKIKRQSIA